jgi:hypothetical protein
MEELEHILTSDEAAQARGDMAVDALLEWNDHVTK